MQSRMAAALADIKPYVATVTGVALLGAPAEIAVPIVRCLRRQSGVSVGPGLINLLNGTVALAVAHYFRRHPAQWQRLKEQPIPRLGGIPALAYLALSPAAAALWKQGAVFRHRSPLWGALASPIGLLQFALVLVALHRARRSQPTGGTERSNRRSAAQGVDDQPK
jgi:hypothetical protein